MDWKIYLSDAIAWVALAVSIASAWYAYRMVEIERRRDQDAKRATLRAQVYAGMTRVSSTEYDVVISNDGPSEAIDLKVSLDGHPATEWVPVSTSSNPPPYRRIEKDVHERLCVNARIRLRFTDTVRPRSIQLTWTDSAGEGGAFQTEL